jgi:GNAT superfamily N-acetyltransferase
LTRAELAALGITEETVAQKLQGAYSGWVCEADGKIVGFAMGDCATGELWVVAVLPEYCGLGIGSGLIKRVESWLAENGCKEFWLTTDVDPGLRAYSFYRKHGWKDAGIRDGLRYMAKQPNPH